MRPSTYPLALAVALGTVAASAAWGAEWAGAPRSDRYFVGYYRADNLGKGSVLPLNRIKYEYYTHIIHIGLSFHSKGILNTKEGRMPSKELTAAAHRHGVVCLVSLVGKKADFEHVAADPDVLRAFVSRMADLVQDCDYDGIDVDWEHPDSPAAGKGWTAMMQALRASLDQVAAKRGRRYWLTTALPAGWGGAHLDSAVVRKVVDFINVMCYDGFGPWGGRAGNHAPLFADPADPRGLSMAKGMRYWRDTKKIPADKLVMGMPFYGYICYGYKPYGKIDPKAPEKRVDGGSGWSSIRKKIKDGKWERRFEKTSMASWFFAPDDSAFVAADDAAVIALKTRWAAKQGFRGVFMWSMRLDVLADGSRPLLDAMHRAWNQPTP